MKTLLLRSALLFTAALLPASLPAQTPAASGQKPNVIVLKLDDLRSVSPNFKRIADWLKTRNIKSSFGIIANSLEGDKQPYYDWIKEENAGGLVEFWFHGYDHKMWKDASGKDLQEFKGVPYETQKEHFVKSQALAKEKLGFPFRSFGSPFNGFDEATIKVLSEDPDIKAYMYGPPAQAGQMPNLLVLDRTQMNIENPIFVPNAAQVEHDLKALGPKREVFVIQGHPDQWDEARVAEFGKMVDYLVSQGVVFTTPYDYYLYKQDPAAHPLPAPATAGAPIPANSKPISDLKAAAPKPNVVPPKPAAAGAKPVESDSGENLITNGDFEDGKKAWSVFAPPDAQGGNPVLEVSGEDPHTGGACGMMNCSSAVRFAAVNFASSTNWTPGDRYRVSAWIRASADFQPQSGTPGFMVRASMFGDAGASVQDGLFYVGINRASKSPDITPYNNQGVPTTWTKVEGVFEISEGTKRVNVCAFIWKGTGSLFIDDFRLELVDKSTPLSGQ